MRRRKIAESGFTLLELLISITLVAVLMTACLMAVRLATASREMGTQKADMHQRLRVLNERLNSTLRSAYLIFISAESKSLLPEEKEGDAGKAQILAFEGMPDSLKFVTFSDKLTGGNSSPWMHEVHFYLQKDEETGQLEIVLNERDFSRETFFEQDSAGLERGQTLLIAQDVAYLKFRYYYEISEPEEPVDPTGGKSLKISGEWADKFITEPIDFKGSIGDNKSISDSQDPTRLPRAVEVSVGLWEPDPSEEGQEPRQVELPPTIIPIQMGVVFERPEEEEDLNASEG